MHNIHKLLFYFLFGGLLWLTSCDSCWQCTYNTTISTPDTNYQNKITESTCVVSEKDNWEALGYDCN